MQSGQDAAGRLTQRAARELRHYIAIAAYLYVCFGAVLFYKAAVLQAAGVPFAPYGLAAIKALIMAKFMLIGHALHVGEAFGRKPLIYPVLYRSFVFLLMLLGLSVIEEIVRGLIAQRSLSESLAGFGGGTVLQVLATSLLMWLCLLPYFAFRQLAETLGEDRLRQMFFRGA